MGNKSLKTMSRFISLYRCALTGVLLLMLTVVTMPSRADSSPKRFRIGYQKAANTLVLLKTHDALTKRLHPLGAEELPMSSSESPLSAVVLWLTVFAV